MPLFNTNQSTVVQHSLEVPQTMGCLLKTIIEPAAGGPTTASFVQKLIQTLTCVLFPWRSCTRTCPEKFHPIPMSVHEIKLREMEERDNYQRLKVKDLARIEKVKQRIEAQRLSNEASTIERTASAPVMTTCESQEEKSNEASTTDSAASAPAMATSISEEDHSNEISATGPTVTTCESEQRQDDEACAAETVHSGSVASEPAFAMTMTESEENHPNEARSIESTAIATAPTVTTSASEQEESNETRTTESTAYVPAEHVDHAPQKSVVPYSGMDCFLDISAIYKHPSVNCSILTDTSEVHSAEERAHSNAPEKELLDQLQQEQCTSENLRKHVEQLQHELQVMNKKQQLENVQEKLLSGSIEIAKGQECHQAALSAEEMVATMQLNHEQTEASYKQQLKQRRMNIDKLKTEIKEVKGQMIHDSIVAGMDLEIVQDEIELGKKYKKAFDRLIMYLKDCLRSEMDLRESSANMRFPTFTKQVFDFEPFEVCVREFFEQEPEWERIEEDSCDSIVKVSLDSTEEDLHDTSDDDLLVTTEGDSREPTEEVRHDPIENQISTLTSPQTSSRRYIDEKFEFNVGPRRKVAFWLDAKETPEQVAQRESYFKVSHGHERPFFGNCAAFPLMS
mmetsp:Transcript_2793/g.10733  ORF Transcript_2793/g.10733 Transcript_2793/m.10733 type:complete len:625 (-) Transcript_2793:172-2046(-)